MSRVLTSIILLSLVSSASAQIFYEPVKYQYEAGGTTYYYGGSNPSVHQMAREPASSAGTWGRVNGFAFVSGNTRTSREVSSEPDRVYTDALPTVNAHAWGFTPDDARNEAYANVPRYFAKRDVPAMAVRKGGMWVVPAAAKTPIRIFKSTGQEVTPPPSSMPRPLLIIPKDMLQPKPSSDKLVASAN